MKIICEHCGSSIDLDKDKICPNCKAPFSKNQDYNEYKENIKKESDINIKSKELDNQIKEKTMNIMDTSLKAFNTSMHIEKIIFTIAGLIIIGAIAAVIIIHFINFDSDFNNSRDDKNNVNEIKNDSIPDQVDEQYEKIKEEMNKRYEEMESFNK